MQSQNKAAGNEVNEAINSITSFAVSLPDKKWAESMIKLIFDDLKTKSKSTWLNQSVNLGHIYLKAKEFQMLEGLIGDIKDTFTL